MEQKIRFGLVFGPVDNTEKRGQLSILNRLNIHNQLCIDLLKIPPTRLLYNDFVSREVPTVKVSLIVMPCCVMTEMYKLG